MDKNSQAVIPDNIIVVEGNGLNPVPTPEAGDAGKVLGVLNSSGDIGWVEDQSGTLTQVQSDWAETDSSKVSYIDNKPDLSVYATTSAVNTALAGKQDTISDLSEIRAGAAKGDTAVQPATLESYATTSAMNTALAGKQDTISDLATIRSGASAGATAVQPSALESYATTSAMNTALAGKQDVINDLSDIRSGAALGSTAVQPADMPSSDELVPSASSGDAGKVLTVDAQGEPQWVTPSGGTSYSAGDGIGIDANNVISADVDGSTIGIDSTTKKIKLLSTIPSVDQTYNAVSTNAQSGVAVAQAIAAIPSSSYTAGDGIDITSGEISVNADDATLDFDPVTVQSTSSSSNWNYGSVAATTDVINALNSQTPVEVKIHLPMRAVYWYNNLPSTATFRIAATSNRGAYSYVYDGATVEMYESGGTYVNEAQDITVMGPATSWAISGGSGSWSGITGIMIAVVSNGSIVGYCEDFYGGEVTYTVTRTDPNKTLLTVKNPLPASTSTDANKVLTVDSNGAAGWQTPPVDKVPEVTSSDIGKVLKANYSVGQGGSCVWATERDTTYTAGDMINISNQNAISVSTTAGITDIQQVAALPAKPVATVLYLIPEN